MPIIAKILSLPKQIPHIHPCKRKCALCHNFGCYVHGTYPRYPPAGAVLGASDMILVPRFLCNRCGRTFSLLPFFLVRRIAMPLPILIYLAHARRTWDFFLDLFGVSRNTLWAWKTLGLELLSRIPAILELPGANWATLSRHISRWQYPNHLRKPCPTIP